MLIKDGKEVTQEHVKGLADPEVLGGDEMLVPVDMRGTGDDFADVDEMVEKLGPKGAIEAFFKARDFLVEAEKSMPDDQLQQPMTVAAWREVLQDLRLEGEEEEALLDDFEVEEEELSGDGYFLYSLFIKYQKGMKGNKKG